MLLQDSVWHHATQRPGATAIVSQGRRVSYRELDDWSNQIAHLLAEGGCRAGDRVALLIPKSIEAIAGMLGILKVGAMYVPIDTRSPLARIGKILDSCEPRFVLAGGDTKSLLAQLCSPISGAPTFKIGWLDRSPAPPIPGIVFDGTALEHASAAPSHERGTPDDAAHILFTSGSTGTPKGVVITHANVNRFLQWGVPYFGIGPDDRNSCHAPLHFDLSTFDIYGTFMAGAELHLVPAETNLLPNKIADFIRTSKLTQWFSVPSALRFMAQFDIVRADSFPNLKRVIWCGEALPTPTLIYWMRRLPHVQFTNLYGPTETTVASSYHTVTSCPATETETIPIGTACGGEHLDVLDDRLRPMPAEEIGDLYIRGEGLSPGYWNDPQRTADVFRLDAHGERIYKTGDLARRGTDGLFYLLGRSDSQIKSRGYRIELGEIEAALHTVPEVRECAVVAYPSGEFDGTAIACAYVPSEHLDADPTVLKERLRALLPSYMVPSQWMRLTVLPLNGNGKVDRPRVREQFQTAAMTA